MQALVYEGPREMNIREVSEPEPGAEEVLIRVAYSGICGSELGGYLGHNALRVPPLIMGHEFSGEIVELGERVGEHNPDLAVSQRVTVNPLWYCGQCLPCLTGHQNLCVNRRLLGAHQPGSYADQVVAHARMVYPVPDSMSMEQAALTEPVGCAIRAAELVDCSPLDSVLITGLGPIGLLILQVLQASGVTNIVATDTDADRRAIGEHFDVRVLNPLEEDVVETARARTDGAGVDVAIDAVGANATRKECVEAVAPSGRVLFVGLHEAESPVPANLLIRTEANIQGSFAYTATNFADALRWLAADRIEIDPWLIKAPLSEGKACFERLLSNPGPVAKILLHT